jgi:hydrogenase maturation protein HypF
MAEHDINEKVIGVSFDGAGLGTDGKIWGGEFLVCDYKTFKRMAHFEYVPMPGGDKASVEPWRMGVSYLYKHYGRDFLNLNIPFIKNLDLKKTELLLQGIDAGINSPLTSSCGRLIDAVAAICGICNYQEYEAQAAMKLESVIMDNKSYEFYTLETSKDKEISFGHVIKSIVEEIENKTPIGIISHRFHNSLVIAIHSNVFDIRNHLNIDKIVLSGGCFQNRYLLEKTIKIFAEDKIRLLVHEKVPANDGGISLGQLAIAAHSKQG